MPDDEVDKTCVEVFGRYCCNKGDPAGETICEALFSVIELLRLLVGYCDIKCCFVVSFEFCR